MLNQPKILPSTDAQWKEYYQRALKVSERREKAMHEAIDAALAFMSEHPNDAGMLGAVLILERAIRHPILRRAPVEGGGVVYTDDKPLHE